MRTNLTLSFLLVSLLATHGADGVTVSAKVDGRRVELTPGIQTKLIEAAVELLATCSNVVVQPKRSMESARRSFSLDLVFTPPQKFDLGASALGAHAAGVEVKEIVLNSPVSSGGAWIESTQFRWYCSNFNTNICGKIDLLLSAAHGP